MSAERRARAYRSAAAGRDRLWGVANGCFDGLWLGLLDREALACLDETFYADGRDVFAGRAFRYTDEQYNLGGLHAWEAAAIESHFPPRGRVVVTGAGAGREVSGLLERGMDAIGYEPNATLVAAGADLLARRGHPDRLHRCDRDAFPAGAPPCDAVVVGWGSYMLIPGRARRVAFLRGARRVLPDGAPLLCSFFVRGAADARYFAVVRRSANVVRRLRREEPVETGDVVGHNYLHYFTRDEIVSELAEAGFRTVAYEAAPYGHAVGEAVPR